MKYLKFFENFSNNKEYSDLIISNDERTEYDGYSVGDIIISDGENPYTGGNVYPKKGKKYKLVQKNLDDFVDWSREDCYANDVGYEDEQDIHLDKMKDNFDETPPIPEYDDGLHRIVSAKELGHKNILMWKEL